MAIKFKPDDMVDMFRVLTSLDGKQSVCSSRYSAVDATSGSQVEVWSYISPGTNSKGFPQYVESRKALLQRLDTHPDAARHVLRMHAV